MARISTYIIDTAVSLLDKLIGTDENGLGTKNFTVESLADVFGENNKTNVADQAIFKFQDIASTGRKTGSISFESFGGVGTTFNSITTFMVSKTAGGNKDVANFLQLFINKNIILAELDNVNNFGAYKVSGIIQHPTETNFYNVTVVSYNSNGVIKKDKSYIFSEFTNPADDSGDLHFTYDQVSASSVWNIQHDLGKNPAVSVVDSGHNTVLGQIKYVDANGVASTNHVQITFTASFSGKAFLN